MPYRAQADIPGLVRALKRLYPSADCALLHDTPFELLVATILSAQCTDERVNKVTRSLFRKYRTPEAYASAPAGELEQDIHSTGFFRNKAKSIRGMARLVIDRHGGQVPRTMEELLELPGVARKTANVLLGTAFGIAAGVVVDTHVSRLSRRLGLSRRGDPVGIEKDLVARIAQGDWIWLSHALIQHGRRTCKARNPDCPGCPLRSLCPNPAL